MKNYRPAFLLALAGNVLFAAALAVFWWRSHHAGPSAMPQSVTSGAMTQPPANSSSPAITPVETPLAPVQISPQRLQSIGVKYGRVERKAVDDEIRTAGNVIS